MSKITLKSINSGFLSTDDLNANFKSIQDTFTQTLFRDGSIPNNMDASLDLNHNTIINVSDPINATDAVNLRSMSEYIGSTFDPEDVHPGQVPHSYLSGLSADDHPHYLNEERGDLRYFTKEVAGGLFASLGHTHSYTEVRDFDIGVGETTVSKQSGGTFEGDVEFTNNIVVGGVPHHRLLKIKDGVTFLPNDILTYTNEGWVPSQLNVSTPVQTLFGLTDVSQGSSAPITGHYLRYAQNNQWQNSHLLSSDLYGLIRKVNMPNALKDDSIYTVDSSNDSLMFRAKTDQTFKTLSPGLQNQVLTVGASGTIGWANSLSDITNSKLGELQDVSGTVSDGSTPVNNQPFVYVSGTWKEGYIDTQWLTGQLQSNQYEAWTRGVLTTKPTAKNALIVSGVSPDFDYTYLSAPTSPAHDGYVLTYDNTNASLIWAQPSGSSSGTFKISEATDYTDSVINWNESATIVVSTDWTNPRMFQRMRMAHTHTASSITSGTLSINRIPTGTTSSTVALGNHAHSNYQPLDSDLTSIASMLKRNDAVLYYDGGFQLSSTAPSDSQYWAWTFRNGTGGWRPVPTSTGTQTDPRIPSGTSIVDDNKIIRWDHSAGAYKLVDFPTGSPADYVLKSGGSIIDGVPTSPMLSIGSNQIYTTAGLETGLKIVGTYKGNTNWSQIVLEGANTGGSYNGPAGMTMQSTNMWTFKSQTNGDFKLRNEGNLSAPFIFRQTGDLEVVDGNITTRGWTLSRDIWENTFSISGDDHPGTSGIRFGNTDGASIRGTLKLLQSSASTDVERLYTESTQFSNNETRVSNMYRDVGGTYTGPIAQGRRVFSNLRVFTKTATADAAGTDHAEWAINGVIESTAPRANCVAVSGVAQRGQSNNGSPVGPVWGGHFQGKLNTLAKDDEGIPVRAYGAEINVHSDLSSDLGMRAIPLMLALQTPGSTIDNSLYITTDPGSLSRNGARVANGDFETGFYADDSFTLGGFAMNAGTTNGLLFNKNAASSSNHVTMFVDGAANYLYIRKGGVDIKKLNLTTGNWE